MSDTIVIGLGGKLRSGKDTVADYLASQHDFVKIGMSDALREALYTLNPIISGGQFSPYERYRDIDDRAGYTEAKKIPEVRRLLQVLGTEVGRQIISENVWVDIVERRIAEYRAQGRSVALTGVRFENEQSMIRRIGGTLVWITRPGLDTAEAHAAHASEQATGEDFDLTIANVGTLNDLYADTETLLANLWAFEAVDESFDASYDGYITDPSYQPPWARADASTVIPAIQVRANGREAIQRINNTVADHQDERPTAIEAFIERQARGGVSPSWPHYDH